MEALTPRRLAFMVTLVGIQACGGGSTGAGSTDGGFIDVPRSTDGGSPKFDGGGDSDAGCTDLPCGRSVRAFAGEDRTVWAGLAVPLDGRGSEGVSFLWEQVGGGSVSIADADQSLAYAYIPSTANEASAYRFQLTVFDSSDADDTDEVTITVRARRFQDFTARVDRSDRPERPEGIAFDEQGMWIGSTDFLGLYDTDGTLLRREDWSGRPLGINFLASEQLVVANSNAKRLELYATRARDISTTSSKLAGGGSLGPVNFPLPDRRGNIFVSNRTGGKVLRYDSAKRETVVFVDSLGENPNALAWGPEDDVLYVGVDGQVLRVPIEADGSAGEPEIYVDGLPGEVDGLIFDEGRNLWIGMPGPRTLSIAPYRAQGKTTISRSLDHVADGVSRFINVSFGEPPFDETTLYWTNLADHTVGSAVVGLRALVSPLAPDRTSK